jgi:hypothetical protein
VRAREDGREPDDRARARREPVDLGFSEGGQYDREPWDRRPGAGDRFAARQARALGRPPGRPAREGGLGYARGVDLRGEPRSGYPPAHLEDEPRFAPGPFTGLGPRGYRRSDDRIREDVCERLTRHGLVDASEIECEVSDGEVTLSGTVSTRAEKRLAEDAIETVAGVRDVHNRLRIASPGQVPPGPAAAERRPERGRRAS